MILKSKVVKYSSIVCCVLLLFTACKKDDVKIDDLSDIRERGVLRVLTLETAFSYYIDRDERECGLDYDMARNFADYLGVDFELIIADNNDDLISRLQKGEGDLAAYRLQLTNQNKEKFNFVDRKDYTRMVLVQRRERGRVADVTEIVGKHIWVQEGSKFAHRMKNLNDELGGGIFINYLSDTISTEDIVYKVSTGDINFCVADEDMARLLTQKFGNIECGLSIGFNQPKAWAVNKESDSLLFELNQWFEKIKGSKFERKLYSKYINHNEYLNAYKLTIPLGAISPYDRLFKKYAVDICWDWRMLVSLSWNESRFNRFALSSQGAEGLMQMMPRTAASFGLTGNDVYDPNKSIRAGVKYLNFLDRQFKEIEDGEERIKFILAGYNGGPGHVKDAMALAKKYGSNPYKWEDSVEEWMMKLREKKYYKDPVCKHGFFRAGYTVRYVKDIYSKYNEYVSINEQQRETDEDVELDNSKKSNIKIL